MIKKRSGEIIVTNEKQNEMLKKLYALPADVCF